MAMDRPESIRALQMGFLIFAGVVVLFIVLKWVAFLRRIRSMGKK